MVGPIPQGAWLIGAPESHPVTIGAYALPLTPKEGTETFGRGEFFWHGDSYKHPGEASHGCIVSIRALRERIWESGDRELEVTA